MEKSPTKLEWLILEVLWAKSPMFLSEIMQEMNKKVDWKQTTYSTYLKKMCDAGFLGYKVISGFRQYYPAIKREECIVNESKSMRYKLSNDSALMFLACMIRQSDLKEDDIKELKKLIDELED